MFWIRESFECIGRLKSMCRCAGFLKKCSILGIRPGFKYPLISGYTEFSIKYFMIDVWQCSEYALDSKYARLLNMLGLYRALCKLYSRYFECLESWISSGFECIRSLNMLELQTVLNKIFHRRYLTGFWIYCSFKICKGSEYVRVY